MSESLNHSLHCFAHQSTFILTFDELSWIILSKNDSRNGSLYDEWFESFTEIHSETKQVNVFIN